MKPLLWALLLAGCASSPKVYERGELRDLVLKPRKGYPDYLTNQRCAEYKKHSSDCVRTDIVKFDMNDDATRARLRDLKFQCNVNGQRYRICETSRGFCQQTVVKGGWFKPDQVKLTNYLSALSDHQFLVDSKTWCAAQNSKEGRRMFRRRPRGD